MCLPVLFRECREQLHIDTLSGGLSKLIRAASLAAHSRANTAQTPQATTTNSNRKRHASRWTLKRQNKLAFVQQFRRCFAKVSRKIDDFSIRLDAAERSSNANTLYDTTAKKHTQHTHTFSRDSALQLPAPTHGTHLAGCLSLRSNTSM